MPRKKSSRVKPFDKPESSITVAKIGLMGALITVVGMFITGFFNYLGARTQVELPIQVTQTAEARLTVPTSAIKIIDSPKNAILTPISISTQIGTAVATSLVPKTNSTQAPPPVAKEAYIKLISAIPDPQRNLTVGKDVAFSYDVEYFIPEYDWASIGYEPRIRFAEATGGDYLQGISLKPLMDFPTKVGEVSRTTISGTMQIPMNVTEVRLRIFILYYNKITDDGNNGAFNLNHTIELNYSLISATLP